MIQLPAQIVYTASLFVSSYEHKKLLMSVNVRKENNKITITSTDGHRAFRCSFDVNETYNMEEGSMNLKISAFKKRIPKAKVVELSDNKATFKDEKDNVIVINPYETMIGVYPNVDNVWPSEYHNNSEEPITFNPELIVPYFTELKRYGNNVKMETNKNHNPLQFSGTIEDFETQFLLMPVQVRN